MLRPNVGSWSGSIQNNSLDGGPQIVRLRDLEGGDVDWEDVVDNGGKGEDWLECRRFCAGRAIAAAAADDNCSLEVNFSDAGSCRASDISSQGWHATLDDLKGIDLDNSAPVYEQKDESSIDSESTSDDLENNLDELDDFGLEAELRLRGVCRAGDKEDNLSISKSQNEICGDLQKQSYSYEQKESQVNPTCKNQASNTYSSRHVAQQNSIVLQQSTDAKAESRGDLSSAVLNGKNAVTTEAMEDDDDDDAARQRLVIQKFVDEVNLKRLHTNAHPASSTTAEPDDMPEVLAILQEKVVKTDNALTAGDNSPSLYLPPMPPIGWKQTDNSGSHCRSRLPEGHSQHNRSMRKHNFHNNMFTEEDDYVMLDFAEKIMRDHTVERPVARRSIISSIRSEGEALPLKEEDFGQSMESNALTQSLRRQEPMLYHAACGQSCVPHTDHIKETILNNSSAPLYAEFISETSQIVVNTGGDLCGFLVQTSDEPMKKILKSALSENLLPAAEGNSAPAENSSVLRSILPVNDHCEIVNIPSLISPRPDMLSPVASYSSFSKLSHVRHCKSSVSTNDSIRELTGTADTESSKVCKFSAIACDDVKVIEANEDHLISSLGMAESKSHYSGKLHVDVNTEKATMSKRDFHDVGYLSRMLDTSEAQPPSIMTSFSIHSENTAVDPETSKSTNTLTTVQTQSSPGNNQTDVSSSSRASVTKSIVNVDPKKFSVARMVAGSVDDYDEEETSERVSLCASPDAVAEHCAEVIGALSDEGGSAKNVIMPSVEDGLSDNDEDGQMERASMDITVHNAKVQDVETRRGQSRMPREGFSSPEHSEHSSATKHKVIENGVNSSHNSNIVPSSAAAPKAIPHSEDVKDTTERNRRLIGEENNGFKAGDKNCDVDRAGKTFGAEVVRRKNRDQDRVIVTGQQPIIEDERMESERLTSSDECHEQEISVIRTSVPQPELAASSTPPSPAPTNEYPHSLRHSPAPARNDTKLDKAVEDGQMTVSDKVTSDRHRSDEVVCGNMNGKESLATRVSESSQSVVPRNSPTDKIENPAVMTVPPPPAAPVRTHDGERESYTGTSTSPDDDNDDDNDYDVLLGCGGGGCGAVLIEGVLFRGRYLGSTQLISEGQPSKAMRMMQAQEAIGRIKEQSGIGETDSHPPSTLVDLFVSVEKIMVLNTDLQEIMMDHALRTISYIADIGDVLVIMARRGPVESNSPQLSAAGGGAHKSGGAGHHGGTTGGQHQSQTKICCHVFESDEAQLIAQSISQAFQVAYTEFLKANGINDPDLMKEMDYQDVLSQQEIFGEELFLFSNKDMQKEVMIPKLKSEPLGVVIVESGWGSMVPTVVLANLQPGGAAARCGQLNIGDQIMTVNGVSLVGLALSTCQNYIRASRGEILVRLLVVSCTPVVEVLVKRPDIKYQLGFSVQNGVICSLLRGGIAERGGVRVGHRIIEINGQSVVAVPHEKIVSMLASSVGEIHMKTMQTSIYRLLTGQDVPHYI